MTAPTQQVAAPATPRGTRLRNRALVLVVASVAAALVWLVAVKVIGVDVTVPKAMGSKERVDLALGPVAFAPIFVGLAAWGLLAALERFLPKRARLIWTVIAGLVFLVTLPFVPDSTAAEITVLALLHLVVGAILVVGLPRAR
jgi:hypothetical protein